MEKRTNINYLTPIEMDTEGEAINIFYETNLKVNNKKILNGENVFGIIDSGCPTTMAGNNE